MGRRNRRLYTDGNGPLEYTNTISPFIQDFNWPKPGQIPYRQAFQDVPQIPGNQVTMFSDTGNNGQWNQDHNQNPSYGNNWFRSRYHSTWQQRPYRPSQPRSDNNNNFRNNTERTNNIAIKTIDVVKQSDVIKKTSVKSKVQKPLEDAKKKLQRDNPNLKPVERKSEPLELVQKSDSNKASENSKLKSAKTKYDSKTELQKNVFKPKEVKQVESKPKKSVAKTSDKPEIITDTLKLMLLEEGSKITTDKQKCHRPKSINDKPPKYVKQNPLKEVVIKLSRNVYATTVASKKETEVEEKEKVLDEQESPIRNVRVQRRIYDSDVFGGIDTTKSYLTNIKNNEESPEKRMKTEQINMYDKIKMQPRVNDNNDDLLKLLSQQRTERNYNLTKRKNNNIDETPTKKTKTEQKNVQDDKIKMQPRVNDNNDLLKLLSQPQIEQKHDSLNQPFQKIGKIHEEPEESIKLIKEEIQKSSSSSLSSIKKDHHRHSSSSKYRHHKRRDSHDSQKNKPKENDSKHSSEKQTKDMAKSKKLQSKRSFELFGSPDKEFKKLDDIRRKAAEVTLKIEAKTKIASQNFDIMLEGVTKEFQPDKPVYETASSEIQHACMSEHETVPPIDVYRTLTKTQVVKVNVKKDAKVEIDVIDLTEDVKNEINPVVTKPEVEGLTLYKSSECQAIEASIGVVNTLLEIEGKVEPCTQASESIKPIENQSSQAPPVKVVSDIRIAPIDKLASLVDDLQLFSNDTQPELTTMLQSMLAQKVPEQQNQSASSLFSNIPSPPRSGIPERPSLLAQIPSREYITLTEKPEVEREIANTFAPILNLLNCLKVSKSLLEAVSYNLHMASLLHDWPMNFDFKKVVCEVWVIFVTKYKRNDCEVLHVLDQFFNVVRSMPESVTRTPWINKFGYMVISYKNYILMRTLNASASMSIEQRYTLQHQIKAYNQLVNITNQLEALFNKMSPQIFKKASQQIFMSPQHLSGGQVLPRNAHQQRQQSNQTITRRPQNQLIVQQVDPNPVQLQPSNRNEHGLQVVGNTVQHFGPYGSNQCILRSPHPNQSSNLVQPSKSPKDKTIRRQSVEKTPRRRTSTDNLRQALLQSLSQQNMPRPNNSTISTPKNTPVHPQPYTRSDGPPEMTNSFSPPCTTKSPVYAPIFRAPNQFESSDVEDTSSNASSPPGFDNFRIRLPYSTPYNEIHKDTTPCDENPEAEAVVKEEPIPIKVEDFGDGNVIDVDKDWLDDLVFSALNTIRVDEDADEEIARRNTNSSPADSGCGSSPRAELFDIQNRICLCGERALFLCAKCMLVMYCSVKCQLDHWSVHRPICQSRKK
ncbi:unnamed protein product [Brassicogethes aeneus]|uniref:MYND-type domain-containing protein n=1 Tax=Brassicogethes aeneus TaxID=1431903 RepID=A0A9P0BJN7_BRAAE|nr:unnamed protein product [Brassicogethes aeneus]